MQVSVGQDALEICAYSGCFSGPASVAARSEGHAIWTTRIEGEGRASLVIEESSGAGLLHWGAFANLVLCRARGEVPATPDAE